MESPQKGIRRGFGFVTVAGLFKLENDSRAGDHRSHAGKRVQEAVEDRITVARALFSRRGEKVDPVHEGRGWAR